MRRVKLLLCDVDGVLTDGGVYVGGEREVKRFHVHDGQGLKLLQRAGILVGFISSRPSTATSARAAELRIDFLHQEKGSKVAAVESIFANTGLGWEDVCYIGDDVVDLGALRRAGVAVAVANGVAEARKLADYVTRASGGHGAVREVVEMLLKAQGKWRQIVKDYCA